MRYEHSKDSLYHHGILGQKWGQKNGPPYPISSSDHSASEKKAGWKKSLGNAVKTALDPNTRVNKEMPEPDHNPSWKANNPKGTVTRSSSIAGGKDESSNSTKTTKSKTKSKKVKDMSDEELREAVNRLNLEQQYSDLKRNSNVIVRGSKYVATAATVVGSVATLYKNSDKVIEIGKKAVGKLKK